VLFLLAPRLVVPYNGGMAYAINTQKTVNRLKSGKVFSQKQAARIVDTIVDATNHLATKSDLNTLRKDMDSKLDAQKTEIILNLTIKIYTSMVAMCGVIIAAIAFI